MDLHLDGVEEAIADMDEAPDHRSVIIHAQLMRADQLDRAAELGVVPSFFAAHTFFWGDWHVRSFGEDRGTNVSPARWAIDRGVNFTIHNDASVVPPHMMRLVSIAVNRKSRSGRVLGPAQRLTVQEALHAVTLGAASVREIDHVNILVATAWAMNRALGRLQLDPDHVVVDGLPMKSLRWKHEAVVGGDASVHSVACASIVAKVCRDRLMAKLAPRYPGYGWDHNMGYGTAEHRAALEYLGATPHHRQTFLGLQYRLDL